MATAPTDQGFQRFQEKAIFKRYEGDSITFPKSYISIL